VYRSSGWEFRKKSPLWWLFVAFDHAAFVTGSNHRVDGGRV
jgi:hypothetical protein